MALLDVSLADLADYLYITRTSISKWKTGARALKPSSSYFAGIVEYFAMLARDPVRQDKLMQLLGRVYPGQALDTPQALSECIHAFLSGKQLPSGPVDEVLSGTKNLYTGQFSVFSGQQGCEAACSQWIAMTGKPAAHDPLRILYHDGIFSLDQLQPILENGHTLQLMLKRGYTPPFTSSSMPILSHPSVEVRTIHESDVSMHGMSWFLHGTHSLLLMRESPAQPAYSAAYQDALTIAQHQDIFSLLWQQAAPVFTRSTGRLLSPSRFEEAERVTLPERLDWLLPSLPYSTMSRELLMEVLRANGISGRLWTHTLAAHEILSAYAMRLYLPVYALSSLTQAQPVLSLLCGQEIRITQAQGRRHLLDTAAMLRATTRMTVLPLQGNLPVFWQSVSAYVKRNAYAGYLHFDASSLCHTTHPAWVASAMQAMDALHDQSTPQARQNEYVATLLERGALTGEFHP